MDPSDLRADIPVLADVAYLNTGATGPVPDRVLDAACEELRRHEQTNLAGTDPYAEARDAYRRTREAVADFLDADPEEIGLTGSTTDGISRVANAIDWAPGDVVVRTDLEHPAGVLPWQRLSDRGVEVRVVPCPGGRLDREAYAEAVEGARLVCLSSHSWLHGTRLPVREAVEVAHDAGARVLVDAVQSVGHERVDVREWGADAVAASGHKWLLGTWGAGFVFVDAAFVDDLEPRHVGYRSVASTRAGPDGGLDYHPGAARLEVGTSSLAPYAALREAIAVHRDVGMDAIRNRVRALTDRLKGGLDGDRLVSPREFESGLVAIEHDDAEAATERLAEGGVRVRSLPGGDLRASVHAFNTEGDIDALLAGLR